MRILNKKILILFMAIIFAFVFIPRDFVSAAENADDLFKPYEQWEIDYIKQKKAEGYIDIIRTYYTTSYKVYFLSKTPMTYTDTASIWTISSSSIRSEWFPMAATTLTNPVVDTKTSFANNYGSYPKWYKILNNNVYRGSLTGLDSPPPPPPPPDRDGDGIPDDTDTYPDDPTNTPPVEPEPEPEPTGDGEILTGAGPLPSDYGSKDIFTEGNVAPTNFNAIDMLFAKLALSRYYSLGQSQDIYLWKMKPPLGAGPEGDLWYEQYQTYDRYIITVGAISYRYNPNANGMQIWYSSDYAEITTNPMRLETYFAYFGNDAPNNIVFDLQGTTSYIENFRVNIQENRSNIIPGNIVGDERVEYYSENKLDTSPNYNKYDYDIDLLSINGNFVRAESNIDFSENPIEGCYTVFECLMESGPGEDAEFSYEEWIEMNDYEGVVSRFKEKLPSLYALLDGFTSLSTIDTSGQKKVNFQFSGFMSGVNLVPYDVLEMRVSTPFFPSMSIIELLKILMKVSLWIWFFSYLMARFRPSMTTS